MTMEKPRDFDVLINFAKEQAATCRAWAADERAKGRIFPDYWDEEADSWGRIVKHLEGWFT